LDRDEFEPRLSKAKQRLEQLRQNAAELDYQASQEEDLGQLADNLTEFATLIAGNLASADWTTRREIIRALVKNVKLEKEQVRITYRISPRPFESGPFGGRLQHCHEEPAARRQRRFSSSQNEQHAVHGQGGHQAIEEFALEGVIFVTADQAAGVAKVHRSGTRSN
jgi:hypothetical protein